MNERLDAEEDLDSAAEGGVERRDDGGDGDAGDGGEIERRAWRRGCGRVTPSSSMVRSRWRGDAPVGDGGGGGRGRGCRGVAAVRAEDRVGVAYVDGQEHGRGEG